MKKLYILSVFILFLSLIGCANTSPSISNYSSGNNLEYSISEIENIHIEMMLGEDQGHIIFNTTENKKITISGNDSLKEDYNFRYLIKNKTLYIREQKLLVDEKRPKTATQTIILEIPKDYILGNLYFKSANSKLEINDISLNKIEATANGKQIYLNNVTCDKIWAKTWTGGLVFNNTKASEMYLTTTYADINLSLNELPNKINTSATSGNVNINLNKELTNFTVYPGNKIIEIEFESTIEQYQDGDVTKTKYVIGNGEKEIHFSGKDNHLHILFIK